MLTLVVNGLGLCVMGILEFGHERLLLLLALSFGDEVDIDEIQCEACYSLVHYLYDAVN